jgi:hypothetical protein
MTTPPDQPPKTAAMNQYKVPGRCYCGGSYRPETSILGHERGTSRCIYRKPKKT